MIPIEELEMCEATALQPGDIAILSDLNSALVVVGKAGDDTPIAVYLHDEPGDYNYAEVRDLHGLAIRLKTATIEVDPMSAKPRGDRDAIKSGLVFGGGKVFISAFSPHQFFAVDIGDVGIREGIPRSRDILFARWRIVRAGPHGTDILKERNG